MVSRIVIVAVLAIIAAVVLFQRFRISKTVTVADPNVNVESDENTANANAETQPQNSNTPRPKVSENESPRAMQDRLFYNVYYYNSFNEITIDLTLTANDADRQINGLTIDLASQEPPLSAPTNLSAAVNGGGIAESWNCVITGTTINCNGTAALETDAQSTFAFQFTQLSDPPDTLTIDLLENGSTVTTIMPLLQPSGTR